MDRDRNRVDVDRDRDRTDVDAKDGVTLHAEDVDVHTEKRDAGRVRLRKYTVTENVTKTVPVTREEVVVERTPATGAAGAAVAVVAAVTTGAALTTGVSGCAGGEAGTAVAAVAAARGAVATAVPSRREPIRPAITAVPSGTPSTATRVCPFTTVRMPVLTGV